VDDEGWVSMASKVAGLAAHELREETGWWPAG
jgi:hypothetical protein